MNILKKYWILDSYLIKLFSVGENVLLFSSKNYDSKYSKNKLDNNLFVRSLYTVGIKDSINKSYNKQFIYSSYFSNIMSGYVEIVECKLSEVKDLSGLDNTILCLYSNTILFIDKLKDLSSKDLLPSSLVSLFSSFAGLSSYNSLGAKTIGLFNSIKDKNENK